MWTLPYVPGPAFGEHKPVYVLTGPDTFSAAEDLAYTLQQLGGARTVGEPTRGGAHPREQFRVDTHLDVTISFARSINPVSGTNWEGTGVRPDVPAPAADAFERAYRLALDHVLTLGETGPRGEAAAQAKAVLGAGADW